MTSDYVAMPSPHLPEDAPISLVRSMEQLQAAPLITDMEYALILLVRRNQTVGAPSLRKSLQAGLGHLSIALCERTDFGWRPQLIQNTLTGESFGIGAFTPRHLWIRYEADGSVVPADNLMSQKERRFNMRFLPTTMRCDGTLTDYSHRDHGSLMVLPLSMREMTDLKQVLQNSWTGRKTFSFWTPPGIKGYNCVSAIFNATKEAGVRLPYEPGLALPFIIDNNITRISTDAFWGKNSPIPVPVYAREQIRYHQRQRLASGAKLPVYTRQQYADLLGEIRSVSAPVREQRGHIHAARRDVT